MAWDTSDRRARLPRDWRTRRLAVLARDGYRCTAAVHAPGCTGRASEVDHVIAGDDHDMGNLASLSVECHRAKTASESSARARARARARRRPVEDHPGLERTRA